MHPTTTLATRLICLLATLALCGCVDRGPWNSLGQRDAPWVGGEVRADLQSRWRSAHLFPITLPAETRQYRYVDSSTEQVFNPVAIGRRAQRFLRRHDALVVELAPSHRGHASHEAAFAAWQRGRRTHHHVPLVTPFRMNLVSIDPVVIVVTDEMSRYNESRWVSLFFRDSPPALHLPLDDAGTLGAQARRGRLPVLPGGVIPRTRFELSGELRWFSPTMNVPPAPLQFDDDQAVIPVPWGRLLVRRVDGYAEVTAEAERQ